MQCLNQSIVKRTPDIWTSDGWVELGPGRFCWKNVAAKIFVSDRFTHPSGSQLWALKQCKILDLKNICPWLPFFVSLYFPFHSCAHLSIFLSKKKFWRNYANFWCSDDLWPFFLRLSITQAWSLPLPSGQNLLVANSVPLQQGWTLKSIIN